MRILELRTENIKNLKAIEIKPSDDAVILTGRNGAGKSAVLDSIFIALTGKKIEQPIRNGEKCALIEIDLGEYKIKRIYTEKTDRLEVLSKEGAAFKSPQQLLNTILGNLSFDPLDFSHMREKDQRALLAQLVGLDFTGLNKERERLYNERTIKNREIKGSDAGTYRDDPFAPLPLESLISKIEVPEPGTPRQEIFMAEELFKIEAIEEKRNKYVYAIEAKEELQHIIANENVAITNIRREYKTKIEDLQAQIKKLEETEKVALAKCNERINHAARTLEGIVLPEEIKQEDVTKARQALAEIEEKNIKIRKAIEYDKKQAELKAAKQVIATLESDMMKVDLEKDRCLKEAKFPIEGLSLTDACVTFNAKPFSQLSTGEQICVSTAIAMALNPQLRIILVRDGSLLDKAGTDEIIKLAKERDYQLWLEKCEESGAVGIYIESGEIVSINGKKINAKKENAK